MSRPGRSLLLLGLLSVAFGGGLLIGRYRWFPYPQATSLYMRVREIILPAVSSRSEGLWHQARDGSPAPIASDSERDRLHSVPYLQGTRRAPAVSSVTVHDPESAYPGWNLVVSGHAPEAVPFMSITKALDSEFASMHPMFDRGDALVSLSALNILAVVDLGERKTVWSLAGKWLHPHQPTALENGNLLVFDNLGRDGGSIVEEINPLTQETVWSYDGEDHATRLYSPTAGSNQRLANGNTLITESDAGRAFEVSEDGSIVWEYYNPHRAGDDGELIATLFEVVRIDHQAPEARWLPVPE